MNPHNERIKHAYYTFLKEAHGNCPSTIEKSRNSIIKYELFTRGRDFTTFDIRHALQFKEWLSAYRHQEEPMSISSYCCHLRNLRMFFEWLCQQPGYRRKIDARYPQYLKPMAKEQHKAQISSPREIPTLEYVVALAGSIKGKSDVDSRDRALISFLAMTGMRDAAVITLPLGCYDAGTNIVSQDPRKGVRTKFNKHIVSIVFPFRAELQHHWQQWLGRLHELGYQEKDPLFPRTVVEKVAHGLCYCNSDNVEPVFWSCTQSLRNVLKRRSQQAGLKYHPPHSYRHLAIRSAFDLCDGSGIHFKAVSQNFGHNDVMMTIGHYGDLEQSELLVVLNQLISTTDREYRKEHRETVTVPREAAELIARAIKGM